MTIKSENNEQMQPQKTVKGVYNGWKYEIDAEYEREFISYLETCWSHSIIGPGTIKFGAPDCFKHLRMLEIPETVKTIEPYTFADCTKLQSIRCDGCELISRHAFRNCEQLIYAHFPKTKVIQAYSFCGAGIKSPVFTLYTPAVTSIDTNGFINCGAQVLYFPSLSNMVYRTIVNCPNLEQLSVPAALSIENSAIVGNKKLDSVYAPNLRHVNQEQIDNLNNLSHFIVSQQAKQTLVRSAEDESEIPNCFVSISEYQKDSNKPKRH